MQLVACLTTPNTLGMTFYFNHLFDYFMNRSHESDYCYDDDDDDDEDDDDDDDDDDDECDDDEYDDYDNYNDFEREKKISAKIDDFFSGVYMVRHHFIRHKKFTKLLDYHCEELGLTTRHIVQHFMFHIGTIVKVS